MPDPLVSVVIPAYNAGRFLGETLEAVLAQTYEPVEVIVIDDGSTDGTAEVAAGYPVRLLRGPNGGRSIARNRGLEVAEGELIAFCDADDLWLKRRLEAQVALLEERPELSIASCLVEPFLQPGVERPRWVGREQLAIGRTMIPSAILVRRGLVDEIGGFDPAYVIGQDTDWMVRAFESGAQIGYVDEVLVRYRIHDTNCTHDREGVRSDLFRLLRAATARRRLLEEEAR